MKKLIYEQIYQKLSQLIDFKELQQKKYLKFERDGFMDLHIDFLRYEENDSFVIAMAHNYKQNGDIMADPDMEIRVYPKNQMAEALTFQQDNLGIYQRVYQDDKVNVKIKKDLNYFLDKWLTNLKSQNYHLSL